MVITILFFYCLCTFICDFFDILLLLHSISTIRRIYAPDREYIDVKLSPDALEVIQAGADLDFLLGGLILLQLKYVIYPIVSLCKCY